MKNLIFALVVAGVLAGATTAQYHDLMYLTGGYSNTSTLYSNGVYLSDIAKQTYKHLTPNDLIYRAYSIEMDADNKRVVLACEGSTSATYSSFHRSGIYRVDPGTLSVTTFLADTLTLYGCRSLMLDQDGDYVFTCYSRTVTPSSRYDYRVFKLSAGSTLTTLLTTSQLSASSTGVFYQVGKNMDTGRIWVNTNHSTAGIRYGIIEVDLDGTLSTWSTGSTYGWYGSYYHNLEQDFDTGFIRAMYGRVAYELQPGNTTRTTLYNIGYPAGFSLYNACRYDLQTAANKRWVVPGYYITTGKNNQSYYAPAFLHVDTKTYASTGMVVEPKQINAPDRNYPYAFDFYRGRHVQTVKAGTKKWNLHISCPRFPNKSYVAALSLGGYRPAVKLPDGRKIHLIPDKLTPASINNWLRPVFDAGPLTLDQNGEAVGSLDLNSLPKLGGVPLWIAVAVLDPAAPNGIAYLPDTIVFRIP